MVNWKNVRLIFQREVRDQLRDRRTLFMVAVLPLLLYPALGLGMVQLTVLFSEHPRTVVLLGEQYLPQPQLLEGNRFNSRWFRNSESIDKLEVITERSAQGVPPAEAERISNLLRQSELIREKLLKKEQIETAGKQAIREGRTERRKELAEELDAIQSELSNEFAASQIQVLVIIPRDFNKNIELVNQELAERGKNAHLPDYPRPIIVHNNADEKSLVAYPLVKEALDRWEDEILSERLKRADLPASLPKPVKPVAQNLALKTQIAANLWSKMFPALLVIMSVTGAFYPAIDLGAGEKERGTMETLLICPAARTEIVLGKFFTVMCFSVATAILNLISMGLTGQHMVSMLPRGPTHNMDVSFPDAPAILAIVIFLIPLAAMFSALCLALATFARSSKEGQYYLTPLLMVTLGLTVFCISPEVEITYFYSVMPIAGVALLLKGLLLGQPGAYLYLAPVLITTLGYSVLSLWWAIDQFQREEVLFREAERFELGLWIRHLLRDKEPTPSFMEAGFCFVLIMLLQFAAFKALAQASIGPENNFDLSAALRIMLIQQIAIVASPALFMGLMLTTSFVRTFRLRMPRLDLFALGGLLAFICHPLALELGASLKWFFPPLPESIGRLLQGITGDTLPLWYVLLAFAVAPAICEEIAFRGFVLSGFNRNGRAGLAIVLSSLAFGVMHMIPQQVFNATILGLLLGLLAIRSGSIFPCMLFHMIFNSLLVMHGRLSEASKDHPFENVFATLKDGELRYTWVTIVLASLLLVGALRYLTQGPRSKSPAGLDPLDVPEVAGNAFSVATPKG